MSHEVKKRSAAVAAQQQQPQQQHQPQQPQQLHQTGTTAAAATPPSPVLALPAAIATATTPPIATATATAIGAATIPQQPQFFSPNLGKIAFSSCFSCRDRDHVCCLLSDTHRFFKKNSLELELRKKITLLEAQLEVEKKAKGNRHWFSFCLVMHASCSPLHVHTCMHP